MCCCCFFFLLNQEPICCLLCRGVLCSQLYLIVLQPERERTELNLERERENEPVLVLAVMEPDLQPLTIYNEHAPGAHRHRHPQQAFGVSKEVIEGGR